MQRQDKRRSADDNTVNTEEEVDVVVDRLDNVLRGIPARGA
jgi:hypothetical protein